MSTSPAKAPQALTVAQLYTHCDPDQFEFETTADFDTAVDTAVFVVGQERAEAAIRFGTNMRQDGYNLFVQGPKGSGKFSAVKRYLREKAEQEPDPPDWCYLYNFDQPHQPMALSLPPGMAQQLQEDMAELLDELRVVLPTAYESEEYQAQRRTITDEVQQRQEERLETLQEKAKEKGISLMRTPNGLAFAPLEDGEVISPDEFQELPEEKREEIQGEIEELQTELQRIIGQVPQLSREVRERLRSLDEDIARAAIEPLFAELVEKYEAQKPVLTYLDAAREDVVGHLAAFRQDGDDESGPLPALTAGEQGGGQNGRRRGSAPFFNRYQVNVLVDNSKSSGAPVIYENHPTYQNLIGRVEYIAQMGTLVTDFTQLKPGALHKANGGYLLLDVRKLLLQPYSWESLKRALQAQEIKVESLGQSLGLISTVSLEPEPIPLAVKVVLLGERMLYYLLMQMEPEFAELFKVSADFEDDIVRNADSDDTYARLIGTLGRQNDLRPFHKTAVARVIEHSARLAGDAERLSTHQQSVADLLREADYWAGEADNDVVLADNVQRALDEFVYRQSRIRERMQDAILRETILIDTDGSQVGQINGLAVLQIGNYAFGRPSRITARVRLGKGEVVDIERQVEMGGPLHSKGVMILTGFLGGRFAAERPLSLSASLVFEQSYGGVDGDSASSAELYALLSALAEAPIKQSLAVTGSVNQHGRVQAIGGVNEKIEGFFDICRERGLTGAQGVMIPAANVKHLMLRQDVVDAVAAGQFHIYPVGTIDEGITLLTGVPAGAPDEDGDYPADSINGRVAARLAMLAEKQQAHRSRQEEQGNA